MTPTTTLERPMKVSRPEAFVLRSLVAREFLQIEDETIAAVRGRIKEIWKAFDPDCPASIDSYTKILHDLHEKLYSLIQ